MSQMEKIFSHAWRDKRGMPDPPGGGGSQAAAAAPTDAPLPTTEADADYVDDEQGLQRRHLVDTTLTIHFFGKKGKDELRFEGFRKYARSSLLGLYYHRQKKSPPPCNAPMSRLVQGGHFFLSMIVLSTPMCSTVRLLS